jgi:hypothetical protein
VTVSRSQVISFIADYEAAWRTPGTEPLGDLFTADATYRMSPYEEPIVGLEAIEALSERERAGYDEAFAIEADVVAVEGDTGVVQLEVRYGEPRPREYRDLWVVRFAGDGRCRAFEEWPYWDGQQLKPT